MLKNNLKYIIFVVLLVLTNCNPHQSNFFISSTQQELLEEKMTEIAISDILAMYSLGYSKQPFYLDTNLVNHLYLDSDNSDLFKNMAPLCTSEYGQLDFEKKRGKITIPDSLRNIILPISFDYDFEKDSANYYSYTMPIWSKSKKVYVYRFYQANHMDLIHRELESGFAQFSIGDKILNDYLSCNSGEILRPHFFSSRYWVNKKGEEFFNSVRRLRALQDSVNNALDRKQ